MSLVHLNYKNLEDSVSKAKSVRNEISGYISEIRSRVISPISDLPGSDSSGYAASASQLANQKIRSLQDKMNRFSTFENNVTNLVADAKQADKSVSTKIDGIASLYIEKRNWFQRAGDWIYDTFCIKFANSNVFTRVLSNLTKMRNDFFANIAAKARDYFKYDAGKYIVNIGKTLLGIVLAVAGVIAAVVSLPVTGTAAIIIGVVSLVAATISMVITIYNSEAAIEGNIKAWKLSNESVSAARYYGNIETLSDKWNKTDMGDQKTNDRYETAGKVIDGVKVVADTTQFVCNVLNLGVKKDFRFKEGYGNADKLDFSFNNIKRNIMHNMEIVTSKVGKKDIPNLEKVNWDEVVDIKKWFGGYSKGKFSIDNNMVIPEWLFQVFNVSKIIKTTNSTVENAETVVNWLEGDVGFFKGIQSVLNLSEGFSFGDEINKYFSGITKTVESWHDFGKDLSAVDPELPTIDPSIISGPIGGRFGAHTGTNTSLNVFGNAGGIIGNIGNGGFVNYPGSVTDLAMKSFALRIA